MNELVYRDILGNNPRKREVSIEETSRRRQMQITKKWIRKYFVKEKFSSPDVGELKNWIREKKKQLPRRDCHVLRQIDTCTGENKIICKVLGDIFLVCGNTAYKIIYINELKVRAIEELRGERRIK